MGGQPDELRGYRLQLSCLQRYWEAAHQGKSNFFFVSNSAPDPSLLIADTDPQIDSS